MKINDELLDIEGIKGSKKSLLELFIRRTAVITSTHESLSEKIIKDQWAKALKALELATDIGEVELANLGTFRISPGKAKRKILKLENHNKFIAQDTSGIVKRFTPEEKIAINEKTINTIKRKTKQL